MTTDYYSVSGTPSTGSSAASSNMRAEFSLIEAGFAKLPTFSGNGGKAVIINAGATALSVTTGTLTLAGNFATSGTSSLTLTTTGSTNVTLPTAGTLSTLAGSEELDNKTLDSSVGKGTWTASGTWTLPALTLGGAITYGGVTLSNAVTGTGNMVLSASPTLTGTLTAAAITASGDVNFSAGTLAVTKSTTGDLVTFSNTNAAVTNGSTILKLAAEDGSGVASWYAIRAYSGTIASPTEIFNVNGLGTITAGGAGSTHTLTGSLAITGALSGVTALTASGTISTTAGVLMAKGALGAHQTSAIVVHQAGADESRISTYGSSATVAGAFSILQNASDGTPSFTHTWDSAGKLTLAGDLAITGALSGVTTLAASGAGTSTVANAFAWNQTIASGQTGGYQVNDGTKFWRILHTSGDVFQVGTSSNHSWELMANGTTEISISPTAGAGRIINGVRIGADSTNNLLDDASNGAGTATLYIGNASINVTSDERVKTNVREWNGDASAILKALPVKAWDKYLSDAPMGGYEGGYVGFTAQDLHKAAPWAVNTQGDTGLPWQARYEFLNGIIVKGWQSHESQIQSLTARLAKAESALISNGITIH